MIFTDPIHKQIKITDNDIYDLTRTAAFQRLQGMKQQGNRISCPRAPRITVTRTRLAYMKICAK